MPPTVTIGAPSPVEVNLVILVGVDLDAWMNWTDNGATIDLSAYHAALSFTPALPGQTVPAQITDTTNQATVGKLTLASTSPNMKLYMPAAVTTTLDFRRIRATLDVTDAGGNKRRWAEATVTLDRGTDIT